MERKYKPASQSILFEDTELIKTSKTERNWPLEMTGLNLVFLFKKRGKFFIFNHYVVKQPIFDEFYDFSI